MITSAGPLFSVPVGGPPSPGWFGMTPLLERADVGVDGLGVSFLGGVSGSSRVGDTRALVVDGVCDVGVSACSEALEGVSGTEGVGLDLERALSRHTNVAPVIAFC